MWNFNTTSLDTSQELGDIATDCVIRGDGVSMGILFFSQKLNVHVLFFVSLSLSLYVPTYYSEKETSQETTSLRKYYTAQPQNSFLKGASLVKYKAFQIYIDVED